MGVYTFGSGSRTQQGCKHWCVLHVTLLVSPATKPLGGCLLNEGEKVFSSFPSLQSQFFIVTFPLYLQPQSVGVERG